MTVTHTLNRKRPTGTTLKKKSCRAVGGQVSAQQENCRGRCLIGKTNSQETTNYISKNDSMSRRVQKRERERERVRLCFTTGKQRIVPETGSWTVFLIIANFH